MCLTVDQRINAFLRSEKIDDFSIFTPSVRKTLFIQKNIKLLNVEFMVNTVDDQRKDSLSLFVVDFTANPNKTYKLAGMDSNTRQATASKQEEMFFKFVVVLFPGDTALIRRVFLEIVNNL
jgi:hypothetical protein